jgi:hypothetical protein
MRGSLDRGHSPMPARALLHATANAPGRGNACRRKAGERG